MYSFLFVFERIRLKYEQLYFLTEQQMSYSLTTTKVIFSIHWYSIQSKKKTKKK